jgi:predicted membrane channel-forming protein YqfA (hemolysin III family)
VVEYYITAEDTFGKATTALNGSDYFSYIVVAAAATTTTTTTTTVPPPPVDLMPWILGGIALVVAVVVLVYIFVIRPKQETT